jgi:hypothetical protein
MAKQFVQTPPQKDPKTLVAFRYQWPSRHAGDSGSDLGALASLELTYDATVNKRIFSVHYGDYRSACLSLISAVDGNRGCFHLLKLLIRWRYLV